jgi:hypothetical protein
LFPLFATGVVDTGLEFTAGVADTGGKFATEVVDTGSKFVNLSYLILSYLTKKPFLLCIDAILLDI